MFMLLRLTLWVLLSWLSHSAWAEPLSYQRDIQPIFNAKCVACHACYDAPCQLNLSSAQGLVRGATKVPVYDGLRTEAQEPTRLSIDAADELGWRRKGFYSVVIPQNQEAALLARMLDLAQNHPWSPNSKLPEDLDIGINRKNTCPVPREWEGFAQNNPNLGMPFAVTGLTAQEHHKLQRWLAEGAQIDTAEPVLGEDIQQQIQDWEQLLNAKGARESLVSRWLYEHLFLAHLYFEGSEGSQLFELVRSKSPTGQAIEVLTTRRPNDDPGPEFYYRIRPIQGAIVHKTHITYALSPKRLQRVRELFLDSNWSADAVAGYGAEQQANPLAVFAAIPAQARYQFMLDDAEYFVRTFIRGPVCRGQIATDVIHDQFWVMFQDPAHDLYVTDSGFRSRATPLLSLPGLSAGLSQLLLEWQQYQGQQEQYAQIRQVAYGRAAVPDWSDLWRGNNSALLTVFRHHDSASVRRGLMGDIPQTLWWLDFPLWERIYYLLVVNFDVFGNVAHQAQTRLHFDRLRNAAEQNFLRLLAPEQRQTTLNDWYQSSGRLKLWLDYPKLDLSTPTGITPSSLTKTQFGLALLQQFSDINPVSEDLNRCPQPKGCHRGVLRGQMALAEQALSRLTGQSAHRMPLVLYLPEVTLLRIEGQKGSREVYSLLRNRAHSNVAFMLGESYRHEPERDTLTLHPGVLSSYPNFIFNVPLEEVESFVATLQQVSNPENAFEQLVEHWGIRRTHPQFWDYFNDLNHFLQEVDPVEAGFLDMNRYQNL